MVLRFEDSSGDKNVQVPAGVSGAGCPAAAATGCVCVPDSQPLYLLQLSRCDLASTSSAVRQLRQADWLLLFCHG